MRVAVGAGKEIVLGEDGRGVVKLKRTKAQARTIKTRAKGLVFV